MADPMKIRAQAKGGITEIRVLMSHAMETGQRKDEAGQAIPAHFIQLVSIEVAGKKMIQGQTGTSISRNPAFVFKVKAGKPGEEVVVSWIDNKGDRRSDKTTIAG